MGVQKAVGQLLDASFWISNQAGLPKRLPLFRCLRPCYFIIIKPALFEQHASNTSDSQK
jgi:hypothetical protein